MSDVLTMPPALVRLPPWTFTLLNCYREICPHQAAERFVYKRVPFVETDAIKRGNAVHKAMELRVRHGSRLPEDMPYERFCRAFDGRKVYPEIRLGVTKDGKATDFFGHNVYGRGKLDAPVVEGDQAFIPDWKTGRVREDPFELEVGAVLLKAKFPHLRKIVGRYVWLKEQRLGQLHDLSDTHRTWCEIGRLVALMVVDAAQEKWEKRQGPLCSWCDVLDCEHNTKR